MPNKSNFHRIKRLPPYVFEEVNRLKAEARNRGDDIIDFGMGNPDLPTPQHIVDKLVETTAKPRTNRYSASRGIQGLRRAQAAYYERRFGVLLNPETQVVATGHHNAAVQFILDQKRLGLLKTLVLRCVAPLAGDRAGGLEPGDLRLPSVGMILHGQRKLLVQGDATLGRWAPRLEFA